MGSQGALNDRQKVAIASLEQEWAMHGEYFTIEYIIEKFDLTREEVNEAKFNTALKNRGIKPPVQKPDLTDKQISAVLTMCNYIDDRSWNTKLKSLGVTPTQWAGWMKNAKFRKFVESVSTADFEGNVHVAHQGLMKAMDRGSTEAIKFYLEATGRHETSGDQNVKVIVTRLIEAIQRHVHDPGILRAISMDFEKVLNGEPVTYRKEDYTIARGVIDGADGLSEPANSIQTTAQRVSDAALPQNKVIEVQEDYSVGLEI